MRRSMPKMPMRSLAISFSVTMAALCGGCASQVELARAPIAPATSLAVVDHRSPEQKERKRDGVLSPLVLLKEDQFSPTALSVFISELSSDIGTATPETLEITEFRIADYFPVRLGTGGQGLMGGALLGMLVGRNTDWGFVQDMRLDPQKDSVLCIFVGRVNGHKVRVSSSEPYKLSPFAALVYSDADFKRAVQVAVKRTAALAAQTGK